ncbi:t-SNARE, partial [Zychaea mexicana]|uniref:t-SNARE n=1 Tax=Zychaea mexicana TaxID=64656 RepID=UPI0022FECB25
VDSLKNDISSVSDNVDRIERLHTTALVSFNEQQSRQISRDLAQIKRQTQKQNFDLKDRIKALEASNAQLGNDSDAQIRRSQVTAALRKRFLETIQRYQDVERTYEQKYRQRVERQIRIVKPDATQEEVDRFIDSDDSPQVFAQSLMHATRTNQARAVLSEVQTRHDDIKHIEKTIVELHQLFIDMQMLVEQQGETLTAAEQNADQTVGHLQQGNSMIAKAILSAKATRHKKWCCLFLVIALCVMIAILVWWFGFGHPVM